MLLNDFTFYIDICKNNNKMGDTFRGPYGVFQDVLWLDWKENWTFLALSSRCSYRVVTANIVFRPSLKAYAHAVLYESSYT